MRILGCALVRPVSATIASCELTHVERRPIDLQRARAQHEAYVSALETRGWQPVVLPELADHPDAVFVEDTVVVLDEVAVMTRPGAASRRGEVASVEEVLKDLRSIARIEGPGSLDGGDVLRIGRTIFVGRTARSDDDGIGMLAQVVEDYGYEVRAVDVAGALHLKTAVTAVGAETIVVLQDAVDPAAFGARRVLKVDPEEAAGANVLDVGDGAVFVPESAPGIAAKLRGEGWEVVVVAQDELAKAEAGLTCCSVLVPRVPDAV